MSGQRIVLCGILITDPVKDAQEIVDGFKEEGMGVKYVDHYNTLPGFGGEGGRTDVVMEMDNDSIMKAAIHPWHLNGLFRWAEDFFDQNKEIVPPEKHSLFVAA